MKYIIIGCMGVFVIQGMQIRPFSQISVDDARRAGELAALEAIKASAKRPLPQQPER